MQSPSAPDLARFVARDIANVRTGAPYRLVRADTIDPTDAQCAAITSVCNEPPVYEFLFRTRLDGAPYPHEKAREFLAWAQRGWAEATHFVFVVVDGTGTICAAADIKSPDLASAEIGYWASSRHAGVMTPAVAALCELARAAGFRSLFATVKPENSRSIAVLERNGFARDAEGAAKPSGPRLLYRRSLR